ncbi:hypothetical protein [Sulfuriferula nivalis]|uniref:Uncharacterized protein n=1 Tax=Sulfuriferula nivalis TaxID=2675298 RepID=A0A809RL36_9PROT|nr:hypothetical protein [Sulfuriferula nivalis]BBP02276.1 hypothetical protein SFSGTM_29840 [Sulfuriferula nivalis]
MKAKPNTEQFKSKKDPSAFLEGGAADAADKTGKLQNVDGDSIVTEERVLDTKIHREQKIFRLPLELIKVLKRESYERSEKSGCRVTETELVEQALREFFNIDR